MKKILFIFLSLLHVVSWAQTTVRVPATADPVPSTRTNTWTQVVVGINDYATNVIFMSKTDNNAGSLTNFPSTVVITTGNQTIGGIKAFTDSPVITNSSYANVFLTPGGTNGGSYVIYVPGSGNGTLFGAVSRTNDIATGTLPFDMVLRGEPGARITFTGGTSANAYMDQGTSPRRFVLHGASFGYDLIVNGSGVFSNNVQSLGNFIGNGTASVLTNQTLSSSASIVTRTLGDARYLPYVVPPSVPLLGSGVTLALSPSPNLKQSFNIATNNTGVIDFPVAYGQGYTSFVLRLNYWSTSGPQTNVVHYRITRYPNSGRTDDQDLVRTNILAFGNNTVTVTNSFANDTDPRDIRFYQAVADQGGMSNATIYLTDILVKPSP